MLDSATDVPGLDAEFDTGPGTDAGPDNDAGPDTDAGPDVDSGPGTDAGTDAGMDAGPGTDAGPGCTPATCNDGDSCNGTETCVGDVCTPGTPMDCDDGVACTVDGCTASACTNTPNHSMCVAPLMCDATSGCIDPTCPETPCRTVPQCGCAGGEGCYLDGTGSKVCAPAGTVPEGGDCSAALCIPGVECVNAGDGVTDVPMCKRYCRNDTDCVGVGSLCIINLTGTTESVCTSNCNVITQSGCPATAACSLYEETSTGRVLTDCAGPVGAGGQDSVCIDDTDCQAGFACIDTGLGFNQCLHWCRRIPAGGDCPFGYTCERLGPAPGLVFNSTEYGVCF